MVKDANSLGARIIPHSTLRVFLRFVFRGALFSGARSWALIQTRSYCFWARSTIRRRSFEPSRF
jgi:hypothetical protein